MKIEGSSIPFHVARAYGLARPSPAARIASVPEEPRGNSGARAKLVAAIVPGRVDFSDPAGSTRAEGAPLAMYRRPGDQNIAATLIHAGRTIDVSA